MFTDFFNNLVTKWGYPAVGGVLRSLRTLFWAAAVAATTYLLDNWADFDIDQSYKVLLLIVVVGLDKYVRERRVDDSDD